jgi:hypothetical protein
MNKFILGTVFGIVVSSIGFNGIGNVLNNMISLLQQKSIEMSKPNNQYYEPRYSQQNQYQ